MCLSLIAVVSIVYKLRKLLIKKNKKNQLQHNANTYYMLTFPLIIAQYTIQSQNNTHCSVSSKAKWAALHNMLCNKKVKRFYCYGYPIHNITVVSMTFTTMAIILYGNKPTSVLFQVHVIFNNSLNLTDRKGAINSNSTISDVAYLTCNIQLLRKYVGLTLFALLRHEH